MPEQIICNNCGKEISEEDDLFSRCQNCELWYCNECIEGYEFSKCMNCEERDWLTYKGYLNDGEWDKGGDEIND